MGGIGAGSRIAIVDDDEMQAQAVSMLVEDAGFEVRIIEGKFEVVDELVAAIQGRAQAAICDHRLSQRQMARFPGAQAVAELYKRGVPAVLLTQYARIDADVTIRRWRPWVPVVLSRQQAAEDAGQIIYALEFVSREIAGFRAPERETQRSLIKIVDVSSEGRETVLDVVIPTWQPLTAVRLPMSAIPPELASQCVAGGFLIASVNTDAKESDDLFFVDFERAPEPVELDDVLY